MISLKKYLDMAPTGAKPHGRPDAKSLLPATVAAYCSALAEMGNCSLDVCPALGEELKQGLTGLGERLSAGASIETVAETERSVREQLESWGRRTARHYREKTGEVKEILLVLARAAESVGQRDQRCAEQITEVTTRLKKVASLDDLSQIRASIEKSASELKTSIERMASDGNAAIAELRAEVSSYQTRLEEAERVASRDALTGVGSRIWVEGMIELALQAGRAFCVAILDIDGFKKVNDAHGHMAGDELLKQFATELKSACRSGDIIGRWGGDEFIILLSCGMADAQAQTVRLREWVCGNYALGAGSAPKKLHVEASIGLAEHRPNETMEELIDRADAEMYRNKAASRGAKSVS
jgi:diguanylate cyclase (GGDEF)-like protein